MTTAIQTTTDTAPTVSPQTSIEEVATIQRALAGYLSSGSSNSRRTKLAALRVVATLANNGEPIAPEFVLWHRITPAHLKKVRTDLAEQFAPATANNRIAALRGLVRALRRERLPTGARLLTVEGLDDLLDALPAVKGKREPKGQHVELDQRAKLFEVCAADPTPAGRRDAAIIALLYGPRRSEVAAVQLADVDLERGEVLLRGKGNKERTMSLDSGALAALRAWIEVRGDEPGPLFMRTTRNGKLTPGGLTPRSIEKALHKRAAQAGLEAINCHDMRRTLAGDMLDAGVDLKVVADVLGHSSVQTTARYDRRGARARRAAAQRIQTPFMPAAV